MTQNRQKIASSLLALFVLIMLMSAGDVTAESVNKAAQIKVAMLYNILKFITWPNSGAAVENGDIMIGIVGSGELNDYLSILDGKELGNRKIKVIVLTPRKAWPENLKVLSVGLIDNMEKDQELKWRNQLGVLTISDREEFALSGGIIGLLLDEGRVKFDINLDAAQENQIIVSSKLASLARIILQDGKTRVFR